MMNIDELVSRVHRGQRQLMANQAIRANAENAVVALSREDYDEMRRTLLDSKTHPAVRSFGTGPTRCLGIPMVPSADLAPGEIRFRFESVIP